MMNKNLPEKNNSSRRNFIKKTGLGSIAALTAANLTATASA
ncbi:MAG: twin-arginine translocation signal domain-containing protein, partial [Sphingobacteriaceae bacterium]